MMMRALCTVMSVSKIARPAVGQRQPSQVSVWGAPRSSRLIVGLAVGQVRGTPGRACLLLQQLRGQQVF